MVEFVSKMPIFKAKNEDFFKKWSSEMAYVLGFFAADGNMMKNKRGAHFMEFVSTDKDIVLKIKNAFNSDNKITRRLRSNRWKPSYRLQIGSKEIFNDLLKLGMVPAKSNIIKFPYTPNKYFKDFIRGYFDGDGHVSVSEYQRNDRKSKSRTILTGFTSGSKEFLEGLKKVLTKHAVVRGGTLFHHQGYRLCFSIHDSLRLYNFMYRDSGTLYLDRKKVIFEHYFNNLLGT